MSIQYRLTQKTNPQNTEAARKFYAVAKSKGTVDLRALAEEIARESSLSIGDIYSTLVLLSELVGRELADGNTVDLGDLGRLMVTLRGQGADSEETYNTSLINSVNLRFKPHQRLKDKLNNAKFERVK